MRRFSSDKDINGKVRSLLKSGWLYRPGKPTQNSYIERFNRTYRHEVLDFYIFSTLTEVRDITEKWLIEYNDERPHESLGDLSPWAFLAKQNDRMNSNNSWH